MVFQVVPRLLDYLRAGFAPTESESYDERFQLLCEVDLLILDDFGAQSNTSWETEKLFQLVNYLYNASAPTVITMNTTAWQQTDPRLFSHFHDTQLVTRIRMDQTQDYRLHRDEKHF